MRKPKTDVSAHGSVRGVEIIDHGKSEWNYRYGVTIGPTCDDYAVFYRTKDIRELAAFLVKAADYIDSKRSE